MGPRTGSGGALKWVAGGVLASAATLAGLVWWANHAPFDAAFAKLAENPGRDADILLGIAMRSGEGADFERAARASSEPGYAAAWCGDAVGWPSSDPAEEVRALGRWAEVDPDNGVPDLLLGSFLLRERGDVAGAAMFVERGLAKKTAVLHSHFVTEVHLRLQKRVGTRDPIALLERGVHAGVYSKVRQPLAFALGIAEQAAWEGRPDGEARVRAEAIRRFAERLEESSRGATDRLVAMNLWRMGAELEARIALLKGDVARARALREAERARVVEAGEILAGVGAIDPSGGPGALGETVDRAVTKFKRERIFADFGNPEAEYDRLRLLGRARGAPRATTTALEIALRDPAAFGPAPPDGPPPPGLVRWLTETPRDEDGDEIKLACWFALPLAQYGRRALPALASLPAHGPPAALLPALVRAGHPDAARLTAAALGVSVGGFDDSFGPPIAAGLLRDEAFVAPLEAFAKDGLDEASFWPVDRALRAIRGSGIPERPAPDGEPR